MPIDTNNNNNNRNSNWDSPNQGGNDEDSEKSNDNITSSKEVGGSGADEATTTNPKEGAYPSGQHYLEQQQQQRVAEAATAAAAPRPGADGEICHSQLLADERNVVFQRMRRGHHTSSSFNKEETGKQVKTIPDNKKISSTKRGGWKRMGEEKAKRTERQARAEALAVTKITGATSAGGGAAGAFRRMGEEKAKRADRQARAEAEPGPEEHTAPRGGDNDNRGQRKLAKLQLAQDRKAGMARNVSPPVLPQAGDNDPDNRGQRKLAKLRGMNPQTTRAHRGGDANHIPRNTSNNRRGRWRRRMSKWRSLMRLGHADPEDEVSQVAPVDHTDEPPPPPRSSRNELQRYYSGGVSVPRAIAVANLVTSQRHIMLDLPRAQEMDTSIQERQHQKKARRQLLICVALGILLLGVLLTVSLLYAHKKGNAKRSAWQDRPSSSSPKDNSDSSLDAKLEAKDYIYDFLPGWAQENVDQWSRGENAYKGDRNHIRRLHKSPLIRAFDWLTDDPNVKSYPEWRIQQRMALASLYYSTDGDNWKRKDGWLQDYDTHECLWFSKSSLFIGSDETKSMTSYEPVYDNPCNEPDPSRHIEKGQYQNLWLWGNNLGGGLPRQLFWLTSLQSINLDAPSDNNRRTISGAFPSEIADCKNLRVLSMSNSQVGHGIRNLRRLTSLNYLRLNTIGIHANLTWMEDLTSLQHLHWAHSSLRGKFPDFGRLTSLQMLNLSSNALSGSISSSISHTSLVRLDVSSNSLSGSLPSEIGSLGGLEELIVDNNDLSGTMPPSLGMLSQLRVLSISWNRMTGYIPSEVGRLRNLERLKIVDNMVSGTIPPLGDLYMLGSCQLSQNQLEGRIPTELGMLTMLTALELSDNSLTGVVPSQLGNLHNLSSLLISRNKLTGMIPCKVWQLPGLQGFGVENSDFQWVYKEWSNPLQLDSGHCQNVSVPAAPKHRPDVECFSESTTVQVEGKGKVLMRDLRVGDRVLTSGGTNPEFQPVYAFGHFHPTESAEFLVIHTNSSANQQLLPLEVTAKHLLFRFGDRDPVAADTVHVGDILQGPEISVGSVVTRIDSTWKRGIYAPFTPNGFLIVNEQKVSSYVAILQFNNALLSYQQGIIHNLLFPMRVTCVGISAQLCSSYCSKDNGGMPLYVASGIHLLQRIHAVDKATTKPLTLALIVLIATFFGFLDKVIGPTMLLPLVFLLLLLLLGYRRYVTYLYGSVRRADAQNEQLGRLLCRSFQ